MGLAFTEDGLNNIARVSAHEDDIQTEIHAFWYSIQRQNWIPNSINQIDKAALDAWTLCTLKGRELDVILRSTQLSCEMPLLDNRKWWSEECMLLKFTPVISYPFSCLCPVVHKKSVLKTILLYAFFVQTTGLFLSLEKKWFLPMAALQFSSTTAGQEVWVPSPLEP